MKRTAVNLYFFLSLVYLTIIPLPPELVASSKRAADYSYIDKYTIRTPVQYQESLDQLVSYLVRPARSERDKLRAVYTWITHNISYNPKMLHTTYPTSLLEPPNVLKSRSTICAGYAKLAQAMMSKALGRKVYYINGNSKGGYGSSTGNHAWNAVELNGGWYFIDCTWGAGYLDNSENFHQRFNEFYFLMPPDVSIYTHFPKDIEWQKLQFPVSRDEFLSLIKTNAHFFEYNLSFLSHSKSLIQADSSLQIELIAPEDVILSAHLKLSDRIFEERFVFIQKEDLLCNIQAVFPKTGEYILDVFAKERNGPDDFKHVLSYLVKATKIKQGPIGLPIAYTAFQKNSAVLYSPCFGFLKAGEKYNFRIKVPNALEVKLFQGKKRHGLKQEGQYFYREKKLKKGEATIYAKFPGSSSYWALVKFFVVENLW